MNPNMRRPAKHYRRISRLGVKARLENKPPRNDKAFIRDRITINAAGCWIWQRYIHPSGYGYTTIPGRGMISAPRLAYETFNGPIPKGQCALHRCDVRACCNPDHLFLGDRTANNADRNAKDRQAIAGLIHTTKLLPHQVRTIRALFGAGHTKASLGRRFAVGAKNIEAIVKRQTWKHLNQ